MTDINLGLRYVLAILPYLFISTGKLVPWTLGLSGTRKWVMTTLIAGALGSTIAASVWIYPDYLAYFNWASGGPDEKPARLIDSNLDWGQDLVALQKWWKETIPGQPIGLAYFGQINPSIFKLRGDSFDWFLPPVKPGTVHPMAQPPSPLLIGPAKKLTPGYYAVSVTLLYGLPWRLYDPVSLAPANSSLGPGVEHLRMNMPTPSGTSGSSSRSRRSGIRSMSIISARTTSRGQRRCSWPATGQLTSR